MPVAMVTESPARVAQAHRGPLGPFGKVWGLGLRLTHDADESGTEAGLGVTTGLMKGKVESVCD